MAGIGQERRKLTAPERAVVANFLHAAPLNDGECRFIKNQFEHSNRAPAGHELIRAGDPLDKPYFLIRGWTCLTHLLPNGQRQILDFHLPGDLVGFASCPGVFAKASFVSLTAVEMAPAYGLSECLKTPNSYRNVVTALRAFDENREIRILNHIVRNGRLSAVQSVASLLYEFIQRLGVGGQASGNAFDFPLTQEMMADALGLSAVHINRTLQQLRRSEMIDLQNGRVKVRNLAALSSLAQCLSDGHELQLSRMNEDHHG